MGSSKKTTVGYWYKLIMHFGWCKGPIDAFLEFRGGDRTAWRGELTSSGQINIFAENLWGGEKSEGGISGTFDVRLGEQAQSPSSYLAEQLGPEQSAYRGRASGVFQGGRYGAFNPYPKPASFKLRRILKGWDNDECWYPEVAEIGMVAPTSVAVYFALDLSGSMDTITPNGLSRLANMKSAINAALDFIGSLITERGVATDIMIVGFGNYPSVRSSIVRRAVASGDIDDLKAWVSGRTSSYRTYFTAGVMDMPDFFAGAAGDATRLAFFVTDGEPSDPDAGMTAAQIAAEAGGVVSTIAGLSCYGINIDLSDTTYTQYVDNTEDDGVPVIEGDDPGAITAVVVQAMLGGLRAINPAHVIYDCLTSADMQGEPVAAVNDASFRVAAQKLYAEGFGICTKYDSDSESLEDFRQRICNVIGATCTRSRVDGQWYLDLIRGVHDLDALLIITDDDIIEFQEDPSTLDDAVNQVVVAWFDPERKEDRSTSPQHSLGAIAAVGGVRSETIEYPEIPIESLALRVAARDLRTKATPLKRFTLTTNRKPHALRLGQFLRLQLPLRGIADMVCMVGDIDTGILRAGSIKLVAVQDVFSMPDTTYIVGEPGVDTTPSTKPQPPAQQLTFEAPYVELAGTLSPGDLNVLSEDAGFMASVARRPGTGLNYELWTSLPPAAYESVGVFDWCPTALIVEASAHLDTEFTLAGDSDLGLVEVGTAALWGSEIVRVDAIDATARTLTLARGCADTVPVEHAAGERIWFYDSWAGADVREYVAGETVLAKMRTRTVSDLLAMSQAPEQSLTMASRASRPYPPGQFKINGMSYPSSAADEMVVSWVHRDRVLQADRIIDTSLGDVGPEPGTTYTVRTFIDGALYDAQTGLAEGPVSVSPTLSGAARIEVEAERGTLVSWQKHVHELAYTYAGPPSPTTGIALPLTYDELDYNGLLTWGRQGGPLPTPFGAEFDGYESRLKASSSLPTWLSSSTGMLTVHATIAPFQAPPSSTGLAISVCTDDANYRPRLALGSAPDSQDAKIAQMVAMSYTSALQTKRLCRREWRYEFRYPELVVGGKSARPQAVLFLDADTVLVTAHYEESVCRCHRIRISDGVVTGWFDFAAPRVHIGTMARKGDGSIWAADFATGDLVQIDLAASLSSNAAVILTSYNCATITGFGSIDWAVVSGTEYLFAAGYIESGVPYLYVIPASVVVDGGTFNISSRTKRFVCSQRVQGLRISSGKIYLAMNRLTGEGVAIGKLQRYPLDISPADGSTMAAERTWTGPGQYVEDIDFHPTSGHIWTGTEGCTAVGSDDGWLAYWSSPLDDSAVENTYTLEYNGAGSTRIKINDRLFEDIAWTPTPTPGCVVLGGRPAQAASWQAGYFSGTIRNVVVQETPMSAGEYGLAISGFYEPNVLTALSITLTNPGAEAGDASGWTNETGVLAVRTTNPPPHSGAYYFYDATSAATLARQRSAMPAADADVDAGKAWARVRWYQATFSTGDDTSGMGIRFLNGTPAQISQHLAASIKIVPTMAWRYRTFAAAVPALTRNIDALIHMARVSGTASDGYTDDITLTVYVQ